MLIGQEGWPLLEDKKINIDPVCLIHGKKMSQHQCLYCCLCFRTLTPEECNIREDGVKKDVCVLCGILARRT